MSDLNSIFNEFAHAFVGTSTDGAEIPFPEALDRLRLDGTLESLHEVDRYLTHIHANRGRIDIKAWTLTLLRAGAYVGEVIRHSAPLGDFDWIDYDDYMPSHPELTQHIPERTTATCAFLHHRNDSIIMPLNKVCEMMDNGSPNSVHYFVYSELKHFGAISSK